MSDLTMGAAADPIAAARRALPLLDLTDLNDDGTAAAIEALCAKAVTPAGPVAAVCIYARFIPVARPLLAGGPVRIATVVNFPAGGEDTEAVARETAAAIEAGADEIDLVLPYRALAAGRADVAGTQVARIRAVAAGVTLKVILETGRLVEPALIREASDLALAAGADFLKTSTGKVEVNATPEAAEIMLGAIRASGRPAGFKAAGGIRKTADAAAYLAIADRIMGEGWASPATFRFGASGLLDDLLATLGHTPAPAPKSSY
jgi:deoxyribose-phosphate aldolase